MHSRLADLHFIAQLWRHACKGMTVDSCQYLLFVFWAGIVGRSGRVVATSVPRVAPQDSISTLQNSSYRTVLFDRLERVLAAGGLEPAVRTEPGADGSLVETDQ